MRKNEGQIAVYSRKSRFTGKGESIGNQVELCREYVRNFYGPGAAEGCVVFEDEGFSGGNLNRPSFQRMMEDVRGHRFRAIVVYRLDRISRNISDFTGLIDELTKLDVSFISIREQFDTSTPMGRAMMFIISVFSQLERETIAERIRDNMHELAKTGRWLGGNTPIGFRSGPVSKVTIDGKERRSYQLLPIPEEIGLPKLIFAMYAETDSLTAVEAELLRRRIKTRRGKDFTRFAIKGILQNPVYMAADGAAWDYFVERNADVCVPREAFDGSRGIMAYNRTEQEKGKTTVLLPVSEWIIALGQHPGVIPSSQWITVQNSLERNKSRSYRKPRRNEALLTGMLFCGCGERMYPKLSKGKSSCTYVCAMKTRSKGQRCACRNVGGNLLDDAVLQQLCILPVDDGAFAAQLERSRRFCAGDRAQHADQLENLRREYMSNEKIIDGLLDTLAMAETAAKPRLLKRIGDLEQTNRHIESHILEFEELAGERTLGEPELDDLRQMLSTFHTCVAGMSLEEKRNTVRALVSRVVWDGGTAHMVLFGADDQQIESPDLVEVPDVASEAPESPWREDSK